MACISPATSPAASPSHRPASHATRPAVATPASAAGSRTTHSAWLWNSAIDPAISQPVAGGLTVRGLPANCGITQCPPDSISRAGSAANTSCCVNTRNRPPNAGNRNAAANSRTTTSDRKDSPPGEPSGSRSPATGGAASKVAGSVDIMSAGTMTESGSRPLLPRTRGEGTGGGGSPDRGVDPCHAKAASTRVDIMSAKPRDCHPEVLRRTPRPLRGRARNAKPLSRPEVCPTPAPVARGTRGPSEHLRMTIARLPQMLRTSG